MGLRFWCIPLSPSILIFGTFSFFGVTVKFLILIGQKNDRYFSGFNGWSSYGYASTIGTLIFSSLVNSFIRIHFSFGLFLGSPIWVSLGILPWLAPLEVLLGGCTFWMFMVGSSIPPCAHLLVWLVGSLVLDSLVHKLNLMRHEKLNPWRTSLACWNVLEKLYFVKYPFCYCLGDECLMESVVFSCWSNISAVLSMWCPRCAVVWPVMNYYLCSRWG